MSTLVLREDGRALARKNIDAMVDAGFLDAIITNTAGCEIDAEGIR